MDNLNIVASFVFSAVTAVATIVTTVTAILAIKQTNKQLKQSNIQQLFDRRLEKYLLISELISNYASHRAKIITLNENYSEAGNISRDLTNCTVFKGIHSSSRVVDDTGEQIYTLLGKLSTETKLIWCGDGSVLIGQFILKYRDCIESIENYSIFWTDVSRFNNANPNEEERQKCESRNERLRAEVDSCINEIEKVYGQIIDTDAENKILNQTSLLGRRKNVKSRKANK